MSGDGHKGKTLGIIGCQVFEDEIVHLLSNDDSIDHIGIVESPESKSLFDKLTKAGLGGKVMIRKEVSVEERPPGDGFNVIVRILPISLHQTPTALRAMVMSEIWKMEPSCGSVLVIYGLCGNAFKNIDNLTSGLRTSVVILKDCREKIVDDCVGAVLGGTEEYLNFLKTDKGGYPLNTMWASNFRHFMMEIQLLGETSEIEEVKFVFQCMNYSKIIELDTGLGGEEYHSKIKGIASQFGFEVERVPCTLRVVDVSYQRAKEELDNGKVRFR
jgi:hypothetical protein